jgi:hypothetical protein
LLKIKSSYFTSYEPLYRSLQALAEKGGIDPFIVVKNPSSSKGGVMEKYIKVYLIHKRHRLNMELDLQSLFGLHVYSCTDWLRHLNFLPPPTLDSYTRALLVSQNSRHLFENP